MRIVCVVGTRPNFVKIVPILEEMKRHPVSFYPILVHTGQHYDREMSGLFIEGLRLPMPDIHLGVGGGSLTQQMSRTMLALEPVLMKTKPDLVLVVGDVNSTLAAAMTAVRLRIPIAHVESGLRSFDREMPEEVNRVLTDAVSDYLFTPTPYANENLKREGISKERIYLVGDVMVDSLLMNRERALSSDMLFALGLSGKHYALLTLHRPSNVDNKNTLAGIGKALSEVAGRIPVVFPVHPRTRKMIKEFSLEESFKGIELINPMGYLDFLSLEMNARFVLTDSGGIQGETTVLGIPCLTLRDTTERADTFSAQINAPLMLT